MPKVIKIFDYKHAKSTIPANCMNDANVANFSESA